MHRHVATCTLALAFVGAGCAEVPAECSDDNLAKAAVVEQESEKTFALSEVREVLDKIAEAREAIEREKPRWAILRDYDDAKDYCEVATKLAAETRAAIEAAKKRKSEVEALTNENNASLDDAGLALLTGRALLDAVPQAALDEKLRAVQASHRQVNTETNAALAQMKGSGFTEDVELITKHKEALAKANTEANALVLEIRRGATQACKPTATEGKAQVPLFIGTGRARSHDGFAIVEAGTSEDSAKGYVAVVTRTTEGGCKTIYVKKSDDPDVIIGGAIPKLKTWNIGGAIPSRLLFAWVSPRAWFISDNGGSWSFDAAQIVGFQGKCGSVTCIDPTVKGDAIDVSCTCNAPSNKDELDLVRQVRFSWQGNTVIAER